MSYKGYTDDDFIKALESSLSIREIIFKLGLIPAGGNYSTAHQTIKRLNLSTLHLTGRKGQTYSPKRPIEDYLSNTHSIQSFKLKNRLIKDKYFEEKCYSCNNITWLQGKIPLELEHINGNHLDNSLDNLTLLCPNCHALTSTYRGKNKK